MRACGPEFRATSGTAGCRPGDDAGDRPARRATGGRLDPRRDTRGSGKGGSAGADRPQRSRIVMAVEQPLIGRAALLDLVHSGSGRSFAESPLTERAANGRELAEHDPAGKRLGGRAVAIVAERHIADDDAGSVLGTTSGLRSRSTASPGRISLNSKARVSVHTTRRLLLASRSGRHAVAVDLPAGLLALALR